MLGRACDTLGTKGERLKTYALSILFLFSVKDSMCYLSNLGLIGCGDSYTAEAEISQNGCDGTLTEEKDIEESLVMVDGRLHT